MRAYLRQWICATTWDDNPHADENSRALLANLRSLVDGIHTRQNIHTFLDLATELGMDPL